MLKCWSKMLHILVALIVIADPLVYRIHTNPINQARVIIPTFTHKQARQSLSMCRCQMLHSK